MRVRLRRGHLFCRCATDWRRKLVCRPPESRSQPMNPCASCWLRLHDTTGVSAADHSDSAAPDTTRRRQPYTIDSGVPTCMRAPPCRPRALLIPAAQCGGYDGLWVAGDATEAPPPIDPRVSSSAADRVPAEQRPGSSAAAVVTPAPARRGHRHLRPRLEGEPPLSSFPKHPQSDGSPGEAGRTGSPKTAAAPGGRGGGGGAVRAAATRRGGAAARPPPQPPAWGGPALQPPDGNGQGCQAPAAVGTTPTLDAPDGQSGCDLGPSVTPRRDLENGRLARSQGPPAPQFVFPASLPPAPVSPSRTTSTLARSGARPRRCACCCASAPETAVRPYLLWLPPQPVSPPHSFHPRAPAHPRPPSPPGCAPVPTVCRRVWQRPPPPPPPLSPVGRADIYRPRLTLGPPPAPSAPSLSHRPRLSRGAPHAHLCRHGNRGPTQPRTAGGQTTGIRRCHRMTRPASAAGGTGESPGGDRGGRRGPPRGVTPDMPPLVWTSATGGGDGGGGAGADAPPPAAVGGHPPPVEDDESLPAAGDDDSGADGEGRSNGWTDGADGGGRPSQGGSGSGGQPLSLRRGAFRKALKVASPPIPDEGPPVEDKALQTCAEDDLAALEQAVEGAQVPTDGGDPAGGPSPPPPPPPPPPSSSTASAAVQE
ncbi:LOW QUALITY PROTEIN: hypothetical protein BU14_0880s0001 [Porphyra umbilicalis]|uniref:Uncharacterized protein n=1 Tax=Porphyra umbilicalis TaxID=2786 RepID=A0A1X6NNJ4_PORUM|nr:LOW QUALITY PROTEIN: hypothetical protein BU14_0880s0001 [Porphyra umbilicalis]|eukprot:OSX70157.1 LOW QUALITY PROTEIN: hypothetical protein BU14_0880s0001 [Porphyra umbilicalis]